MLDETRPAQRPTLRHDQQRTALAVIEHRERGLALQRLLSLYGYSLLIAADAEMAFALADTYAPELLLLDCCLTAGTAQAAFAQLREHVSFHNLPIIMLDTLPDAAAGVVWLAWGAAAYAPSLPNCATLEAALAALHSASGPRLPPAAQATAAEPAERNRAVGEPAWRPISSSRPLAARLRVAP